MTRYRNNNSGEVFLVVLIVIAAVIAIGTLTAWPLMITLGILHSYFVRVPALGFWASLITAITITGLKARSSSQKKDA